MEEINMVFMYTFANLNMANYPPSSSALKSTCADLVESVDSDPIGKIYTTRAYQKLYKSKAL